MLWLGTGAENELALSGTSNRFYYDALHRLVDSTAVSSRYDSDDWDLIGLYNASNALLRRYVFGPDPDEPLVWYEGSGTTDRRWLHADERGSVTAITNSGGGAINIDSYDEYGVPASTNTGRFQYTGQAWQSEIAMYYFRGRMYVPSIGRFAQTDPIGYDSGPNLYAYSGSDPVNYSDPSGLDPKSLNIVCTGSHIPSSCGSGGVAGGLSPGSLGTSAGGGGLSGAVYVSGGGGPATGIGDTVIVTAPIGYWLTLGTAGHGGGYLRYAGSPQNDFQNVAFGPCTPSALITCTNPVDPNVYRNILNKHLFNAKGGKSKFNSWATNPLAFSDAVGKVLEGPYTTVSPGVRVYTQNIGFNVGTDRYTGRAMGLMTVWVQNLNSPDGFWSVANAYPGPR